MITLDGLDTNLTYNKLYYAVVHDLIGYLNGVVRFRRFQFYWKSAEIFCDYNLYMCINNVKHPSYVCAIRNGDNSIIIYSKLGKPKWDTFDLFDPDSIELLRQEVSHRVKCLIARKSHGGW